MNSKMLEEFEDLKNHPDYQAMQKRIEDLEVMYQEMKEQNENALKRIEEQERELQELRNRKKAGRPALDPGVVERIAELRERGLSIRRIAAVLQSEKHWVHPATVGKYVEKINRQKNL